MRSCRVHAGLEYTQGTWPVACGILRSKKRFSKFENLKMPLCNEKIVGNSSKFKFSNFVNPFEGLLSTRKRMSVLPRRCSILEVGEPGDFRRNGATTRGILEVEPTLRAWLSYNAMPDGQHQTALGQCWYVDHKKNIFGTSTSTSTTVSCSRKVLLLAYVGSVL